MNRYWMEDTYGKYGVELVPFGVYRMTFRAYQYFQQQYGSANQCPTPTQTPCNKNFRNDIRDWMGRFKANREVPTVRLDDTKVATRPLGSG